MISQTFGMLSCRNTLFHIDRGCYAFQLCTMPRWHLVVPASR